MKKYADYVHELTTNSGVTVYVVAEWIENAAEWQVPLDKRTAKLTGCSGQFARKLSGLGEQFPTRRQALRRARYLFGDNIEY